MLLVVTTRMCQRLSWTRNIFEISILFCCGLCAAASSRWVRYVKTYLNKIIVLQDDSVSA